MERQIIPYESASRVAPGNALVLAPHPDDEIFGCAGAICAHLAQGERVDVLIATDGAWGAGPDVALRKTIFADRMAESGKAAMVLGYGKPSAWGIPDRDLWGQRTLIERIGTLIATLAPAVVYAPSVWEAHPDHRALALYGLEAVRRAKTPLTLAMYEVGMAMRPNLLLDITAHLARKTQAMACFPSQLQAQDYVGQILALNKYRTYTLAGNVTAAEGYFLLDKSMVARFLPSAIPADPAERTPAAEQAWFGSIHLRPEALLPLTSSG